MKLYDVKQAPNCRRVHVFEAEKGLDIPRVEIDFDVREYRDESYEKLNPFKLVPALELEDGKVITESVSICRYLEMICPEPNLFGESEAEKIDIEMWNRRAELSFFYPVAQAFRHLHPYMKDHEIPQVEAWGRSCQQKAQTNLALFNARLKGRDYLVADRFTIADITLMVATEFMRPARIDRPDDLEHLNAWFTRVSDRKASRRR